MKYCVVDQTNLKTVVPQKETIQMSKKIKFEVTSGNIFHDLGFANPEEEMRICQEKYNLFVKQKKNRRSKSAGTNSSVEEK